jgi:hypothetical protein
MRNRNSLAGGTILVVLGVLFLLSNQGILPPFGRLLSTWWPLFLIVPGILTLLGYRRSRRN